jgi:type IV pilus assembly protein PilY1
VAWRIVNDPAPFAETVAFSPTLPTVDDPCTPSGESLTYAADFSTGISRLSDINGTVLPYVSPGAGVVTDLRFLSVNGKVRLIAGTDTGAVNQIRGNFGSALGLRRLNWRELGIGN